MLMQTGNEFRLEDYRPSEFQIPEIALIFNLDSHSTTVTATLTIERCEGTPLDASLVLDGDNLHLQSLHINSVPAHAQNFTVSSDTLVLHHLPLQHRFELQIVTRLSPVTNTALMGLYQSNNIYCTQCEADGFRRITYFLDRPDILSLYTVRIEAHKSDTPLLLSNGNEIETGQMENGFHYSIWHDPFPKPSYLFALVAGKLGSIHDRFITRSGRSVVLGIYVEPGKEPLATYAMDSLKRSMKWDEDHFGCEYDLDIFNIVAVSDFNIGAMENKGLNIFNDKYILADPQTATDADYANIEAIIAHEYFHNWTGNRITCRDWFQLCLKEGLTVYRDQEFSSDQRSRAVKRITDVRTLRSQQFPEDQGPLSHSVRPNRYKEINNLYTSTVYEKGAEIIRMIHTILGKENFQHGIDLYFKRHDGQAVTIEDFIACFEHASSRDLSHFSLWYYQAGTPRIIVNTRYDTETRTFTVELEQINAQTPGQSIKKPMHIPLSFALLGAEGENLIWEDAQGATIADHVIHMVESKQLIQFNGLNQKPELSINRGFSAPIVLEHEIETEALLFLAQNDSDQFNRWQAFNTLFTRVLIRASTSDFNQTELDPKLAQAIQTIATKQSLEPAFRAVILTLPSEADIAREIGTNINPDLIRQSRDEFRSLVGRVAQRQFEETYHSLFCNGSFSTDATSAGKRSLRNILLEYLTAGSGNIKLAEAQFQHANNMTDLSAALTILAHQAHNSSSAQQALATFEKRHHDNPLVMDKWFSIQATVPGSTSVAKVKDLMKHPSFSLTNPNRVRSLIGSFATANQTGFHAQSGTGYQFLADIILELDEYNPQVASRLAAAYRSWRSLEPTRQNLAHEQMVRIQKKTNLSRDVSDIIERCLI